MATNRKLGKTTDIRLSMLKNLTTDLIWHEKIETTDARAKEVKAIADSLIALAIKEKDNYENAEKIVIKAKTDGKGNKEMKVAKTKAGKEYLVVDKEKKTVKIKKDKPSKLNARRKMMTKLNKVKDKDGNKIDLTEKLFNELATKYAKKVGGYTQIIKKGERRGDGAETVILKLL